jgi:hypothetical protein
LQILKQQARGRRVAAPLGKPDHLEQTHRTVEPDGQNVTALDAVARRGLAHAVDADVARLDELGGTGACFDDPRMPQPFIEALTIRELIPLLDAFSSREPVPTPDQVRGRLRKTSVLPVRRELFLQRCEFCKRRVGIDGAVALARGAGGERTM